MKNEKLSSNHSNKVPMRSTYLSPVHSNALTKKKNNNRLKFFRTCRIIKTSNIKNLMVKI